jgi:ATP dependent DNA ligase domain
MPKFELCLPTLGKAVPAGPEWLHEIKYDGYRLRLERAADRVRLITKRGYDWTERYPRIVEAALKNRQKHFVIDGEAIVRGVDGYSDFNALHSGKYNGDVELLAFDILAMDGDDLRDLPLSMRKASHAGGKAVGGFLDPRRPRSIGRWVTVGVFPAYSRRIVATEVICVSLNLWIRIEALVPLVIASRKWRCVGCIRK